MSETVAIRVYVPNVVDESIHMKVREYFTRREGGVTAYHGDGSWLPDGQDDMEIEYVTIYECVTDTVQPVTVAKRCATMVKSESDEDSVMWEVRPILKVGFQ